MLKTITNFTRSKIRCCAYFIENLIAEMWGKECLNVISISFFTGNPDFFSRCRDNIVCYRLEKTKKEVRNRPLVLS